MDPWHYAVAEKPYSDNDKTIQVRDATSKQNYLEMK